MALNDRQHVEAVAIIRHLAQQLDPSLPYDHGEALTAAHHWLRENHPTPEVYMAAIADPGPTP